MNHASPASETRHSKMQRQRDDRWVARKNVRERLQAVGVPESDVRRASRRAIFPWSARLWTIVRLPMETVPDSAQSGLGHDLANGTSGDEIDDAVADDHNHPACRTELRRIFGV
jgi:hypothetical protein